MSPAEKARQVTFKKEMVVEEARYQETLEASKSDWKKEAVELWGGHINMRRRFVNCTNYKFALMETTDDVKAQNLSSLAFEKLVKIRGHYRVWGSTKDSLVELALVIIDPYYEEMKEDAKINPVSWNGAWMWKLDEAHLTFATKNVYTCYEM
ncbi:hypothetical protein D1007_14952 [Hordeum vulgare]|nr:hypothetical protein D1007_14952 [Hordeum vulgare]